MSLPLPFAHGGCDLTVGVSRFHSFISGVSRASTRTPPSMRRKAWGRAETTARSRAAVARHRLSAQLARSPTVHRSCGLSGFGPNHPWVAHSTVVTAQRRGREEGRSARSACRAALRAVGGDCGPAVSPRRKVTPTAPSGRGWRGSVRRPRRWTTESSSKHRKDCGLGPRLRARCDHPQLRRRVRSRTGGEAGTSRTSGSGNSARAPFPS
jgi:hypothetical protein